MKHLHKGKAPEVDTALNQWFGTVTSKGQKLSGPILKEKTEDLAKKLGHTNFVATEGWLSRWKARHQIRYKRAHGEKVFKVLKSGQALFYQGYWKNIGLIRSIMQMKLGCITEPLLMAHFAIVMKNSVVLRKQWKGSQFFAVHI